MSTINVVRETTIRGEASPSLEEAVREALAAAEGCVVAITITAAREVEK